MQRRLTREELELWRMVTANVRPRHAAAPSLEAQALPVHHAPMAPAHAPSPPARAKTPSPVRTPHPLDARTLRDLRRERVAIDARIDLHGLRAAEAHHALRRFLTRSQQAGARVVLVVTGKGLSKGRGVVDDPFVELGVLRRHVPLWLGDSALVSVVAGFAEASQTHGGAGALYVRLRRREKLR